MNHVLDGAQLDKVSTPPTKNIQYLDSGTSNMDPPKRWWSGMSGREFPCQMSTTLGLRLEVWRMIKSQWPHICFGRIANHQHKPALHFITGWNLQITINPYISYFFLEATQRLPSELCSFQTVAAAWSFSCSKSAPGNASRIQQEHLLATQRTKGANVLFSNSMECMAFG